MGHIKRWSRPSAAMAAVALSGCSDNDVVFEVRWQAPTEITDAQIELCGNTLALQRSGSLLTARGHITCEGKAILRAKLAEGSPLECEAGYITSGFDLSIHEIVVNGHECSLSVQSNP